MNFDQPQPQPQQQEQPRKEYKFSSENLSDEHVLDKVFNLPNFQGIKDFFFDDREGKISCKLTLDGGGADIIIKTKENELIKASSFEEMKTKIQEWIAREVSILSDASMNTDWKINSFDIDYSFYKDEKEEQTGYRNIIDKNFR